MGVGKQESISELLKAILRSLGMIMSKMDYHRRHRRAKSMVKIDTKTNRSGCSEKDGFKGNKVNIRKADRQGHNRQV